MAIGLSIPSYATWSNVRRFGKMLPYYLCDGAVVQQEVLERIVRGTKDATTGKYTGGAGYKHLGKSIKTSILETEKAYKGVLTRDGSFWKYAGKSIRELPTELSTNWSAATTAAKAVGKSGFIGGLKSVGTTLGKKLPLIGSLIYAATEIPNIVRATADGGAISGAAEAAKTVGRMAGFTAGAVLGQVLIPIPLVGGIIGGMVGEKLASLVVGKSYTEQKEEIQQEAKTEAEKQSKKGVHSEEEEKEIPNEEEEYIVENDIGSTLTNKQLARLEELQRAIAEENNNSTFNVSA